MQAAQGSPKAPANASSGGDSGGLPPLDASGRGGGLGNGNAAPRGVGAGGAAAASLGLPVVSASLGTPPLGLDGGGRDLGGRFGSSHRRGRDIAAQTRERGREVGGQQRRQLDGAPCTVLFSTVVG